MPRSSRLNKPGIHIGCSTFGFLVPSNLFAVTSLKQIAGIAEKVTKDAALAAESTALAKEVNDATRQYAIVEHPTYGKVYAFEVALEAKGKINLINSL